MGDIFGKSSTIDPDKGSAFKDISKNGVRILKTNSKKFGYPPIT